MAISDKYKTWFLRIPKTAGTSIMNSFPSLLNLPLKIGRGKYDHPPFLEHQTYLFCKLYNKRFQIFDSYYKFSIVRNPWDRCISSFYHYLSDVHMYNEFCENTFFKKYPKEKFLHKFLYLSQNEIIEMFKLWYFDVYSVIYNQIDINFSFKKNRHWLFYPQYLFVVDENKKNQLSFFGRFENLDQDFKKILKATGMRDKELLKKNVATHTFSKNYKIYFNDNSIVEHSYKLFENDLNYFDYDFN